LIESKTGAGYPFPKSPYTHTPSDSTQKSGVLLSHPSQFRGGDGAARDFRKPPLLRNTLYVGNLPKEAGNSDLIEIFENHNPVSGRIVCDSNNSPKGFGFVEFKDEQSALDALAAVKGTSIQDCKLALRLVCHF
jgi:RNA recognition motif-containing protein